jgi:hypothetical protein
MSILDYFNSSPEVEEKEKYKPSRLSIFEKLNCVFTKEQLSEKAFGRDGYMLLRYLSMDEQFTEVVNNIQKYQGVLKHRLLILLQHIFGEAHKAPFLKYIKGEKGLYERFNKKSLRILKDLFLVDNKRLTEYMSNLWVTDEEIAEIWGLVKPKKEKA